jgi:hypothetical protein
LHLVEIDKDQYDQIAVEISEKDHRQVQQDSMAQTMIVSNDIGELLPPFLTQDEVATLKREVSTQQLAKPSGLSVV